MTLLVFLYWLFLATLPPHPLVGVMAAALGPLPPFIDAISFYIVHFVNAFMRYIKSCFLSLPAAALVFKRQVSAQIFLCVILSCCFLAVWLSFLEQQQLECSTGKVPLEVKFRRKNIE